MAISLRAVGVTTTAAGAVTGVTAGVPAGLIATDLSILTVEAKQATAGTAVTISTPSGWTLIGSVTNNGTNLTAGTDTGTTYLAMFYRVGTYTAPTITTTGANSMGAGIVAYQTGNNNAAWDVTATTTGSDTVTTSVAAQTMTGAATVAFTAGDWVVVGAGLSGDLGTVSTDSLTATGATLGTRANRINLGVTTGGDSRFVVTDWPVTAGPATAAPAYTLTYSSATVMTGHARFVRIREGTLINEPPVSGFTDDFATADLTKWTSFPAEAVVTGGQLQLTSGLGYPRIPTLNRWSLTGSELIVELVGSAGAPSEDYVLLRQDSSNVVGFVVAGAAGARTLAFTNTASFPSIPYDPVAHRWVRLTESGGTITWWTSPDRSTWTSQRTAAVTFSLATMTVEIMSGYTGTAPSGPMIVGGVNVVAPAGADLILNGARATTRATSPTLTHLSALTVQAARTVTRATAPALGQTTPLTASGTRSATRVSSPTLSQISPLTVNGARAMTRAGSPTIAQNTALTVHGARATTRSSSPVLTQLAGIAVNSATTATRAGSPTLTQTTALTVDGARAATRASSPQLTHSTALVVRGATAETRVSSPHLLGVGDLGVDGVRSATRATAPLLEQTTPLTVDGARAETRTEAVPLGTAGTLTVNGARADTRATTVALDQLQILTVAAARAPTRAAAPLLTESTAPDGNTPPERTVTVPAEIRSRIVLAEDRTLTVPAESRTLPVAADDRTLHVPASALIPA